MRVFSFPVGKCIRIGDQISIRVLASGRIVLNAPPGTVIEADGQPQNLSRVLNHVAALAVPVPMLGLRG